MIQGSPAERYLTFLLTDPANLSVEAVVRRATVLGLPWVSRAYLQGLRRAHPRPRPFRPRDTKHRPSVAFMRRAGIELLWHPDAATNKALGLLGQPRPRELVEALLTGGAASTTVAAAVGQRFGILHAPEVIDRYRTILWDVSRLDSVALRALLDVHADRCGASKDAEVRAQQLAYRRAARHDPRRLAASLPPALALRAMALELGLPVRDLDLSGLLTQLRDVAIVKAAVSTVSGGAAHTKEAANLMAIAASAAALVREITPPDEEIRKQVATLRLVHDEGEVPLLSTLGEHTLEVAPLRHNGPGPS